MKQNKPADWNEPVGGAYPSGTLMRALFYDCRCDPVLFMKGEALEEAARECVNKAGLATVNTCFHEFDGGGLTVALVLAESHLTLHSWPEYNNTVLADISVCNLESNNRPKADALVRLLEDLLLPAYTVAQAHPMTPGLSMPLREGQEVFQRIDQVAASHRSPGRDLLAADTAAFGRTLLVNGRVRSSEINGGWYHEPLVHVPLLSHPSPENVLICGGGDGGSAREVLRHASVKRCRLVEPDEMLLKIAHEHLARIHKGALEDPRLEVVHEDPLDFLRSDQGAYDAVLLDLPLPLAEIDAIEARYLLRASASRLCEGGRACFPVGLLTGTMESCRCVVKLLEDAFSAVSIFAQHLPARGAQMAFALCSNQALDLAPEASLARRLRDRQLCGLEIITGATYRAMFALPPTLAGALQRG